MILSSITQNLLSNQNVPYRLVNSAHPSCLAQTHASLCLLKDFSGIVMAIYHNDYQFDLHTLKTLLGRTKLRFMSIKELNEILFTLTDTKIKPFNNTLMGICNEYIQLVIDEKISTLSNVLLVTDNPAKRIQVNIWDMELIIENALIGGIFSHENKIHKALRISL